ncbi:hypothetical protein [Natranaerobius thermophilus]|uniref:Uncharacterized protein n=1 Tax=Natranaerobius thermophilus (strain ATCC BAA-1301 / DSM 18059 / JW/NM-WN-LF) TaxID=457570 RepID=B2A1Q1_NATTJ|nr:hypothetical protein [Natranaerobius thermophilus]ACB86098.1 hypothetical protein Nther_2538 [Natranaerobius thermophilus JW/NM-WN-LF]
MKQHFHLMSFFEGYVRNYRRLNIHCEANRSLFTQKELDYWARLGEMLGFFPFVEDTKPNLVNDGKSNPMDLSWWKWDKRKDRP